MEDFVPLDMSPRSKRSAVDWAKEKFKEADFVAVGVNVVVGALLLGGLVGALFLPGSGAHNPDLNAAIGSHDDTVDNSTDSSSGEETVAVSDVEDAEDEDERQKHK